MKALPNQIPSSEFPIISALEKHTPDRNFIFTAIETFKSKKEVRAFMQEYLRFMKSYYEGTKDTVEVANENVGYILGYYGGDEHKLWYGALNDVSHPVFGHGFGRGENPTPEEAVESGKQLAKQPKED